MLISPTWGNVQGCIFQQAELNHGSVVCPVFNNALGCVLARALEVIIPTPKAFYCWIPVDFIIGLWNSPLSLVGDGDGDDRF